MQREGAECLQGTEEQRKGVNAINPGCSWKGGTKREPAPAGASTEAPTALHKIPAPSGFNPFKLFALWGFIVQYTFNSFAGWNHAIPHGPPGLQEGK